MGKNRVIVDGHQLEEYKDLPQNVDGFFVYPRQVKAFAQENRGLDVYTAVCSINDVPMVKAAAAVQAYNDGATDVLVHIGSNNAGTAAKEMEIIAASRKGRLWFQPAYLHPLKISEAALFLEAIPEGCGAFVGMFDDWVIPLVEMFGLPITLDCNVDVGDVEGETVYVANVPEQPKVEKDKLTITQTELDL